MFIGEPNSDIIESFNVSRNRPRSPWVWTIHFVFIIIEQNYLKALNIKNDENHEECWLILENMPPIMTKYLWVPPELNVIAIPSRVRLNTTIYQPHNTHRFDLMHNITGLKIFRWCAIRITRRDFYIVALSVIMGTSSSKYELPMLFF